MIEDDEWHVDRRKSYVYFAQVRGGGPIKIGCSCGPKSRIYGLQSWCPVPLDFVCMVEGGRDEEFALHDALKDFRMHSEWFEPNEKLAAIIAGIVASGSLPSFVAEEAGRRLDERKRLKRSKRAKLAWAEKRRGKRPYRSPKKPSPEAEKSRREKVAATAARKRANRGAARKMEFALVTNIQAAE